MRALVLVLLVALAMPAISVSAQAPASIAALQDEAGDVSISAGGSFAPNPAPRPATLDLLAANVLEQEEDFVFSLVVAELDPPSEPPLAESAFYAIGFLHGDIQYSVQIGRIRSQEVGLFASLGRLDPGDGRFYLIDYVTVVADPAAATMTTTVPRDLLVDSNGAKPFPGTALTGFHASSQSFMETFSPSQFLPIPSLTLRDRMPDTGNSTVPVPVLLGPTQTGSARLSSPMPFRQSNGEATTFLFSVRVSNVGAESERFGLSTLRAPPEWTIQLAEPLLELAAGESVVVPILVTTPFMHTHGTVKHFLLEMKSVDDPASHAQLELGVRYPKVPQPAGHHNVLSVHSTKFSDDPTVAVFGAAFGFNIEYGWLNALPEDPLDRAIPLPADPPTSFPGPSTDGFHWAIGLSPELAIGLDFDLAEAGSFDASIESSSPIVAASLAGELAYYVDSYVNEFGQRLGGNRTLLATMAASAEQDIDPAGSAHYTLVLTPTADADLVPLQAHSTIVLELHLASTKPDSFTGRDPPKLSPGALLHLPLREFHDPVDTVFASQPELSLVVASAQDRAVNAGRTALFTFDLRNEGADRTIQLALSGPNSEWASIIGDQQLKMASGTNATVTVAVAVPQNAAAGAVADIVLQAEAQDAASLRALARVFATVEAGDAIPDEASIAASLAGANQKDAPPMAATLGLLAVLGLAFARRR